MTNREVAKKFQLLGKILELNGGDKFKARSYLAAYNTLRNAEVDLLVADEKTLLSLPKIGKAIAGKVMEIQDTGTFQALEREMEGVPKGVIDLLNVSGLGPSKVRYLMNELGVLSPGELLYACNENRLLELKGFGEKSQQNLIRQLQYFIDSEGKLLLNQADRIVNIVESKLRSHEVPCRWVGDYARNCPIVASLELLFTSDEWSKVLEFPWTDIAGSVLCMEEADNHRITCHVCDPSQLSYSLIQAVGGSYVADRIGSVSSQEVKGMDEIEIFNHINLDWRPPELRDIGTPDIDLDRVIQEEDIQGLIHAHSTWSDGGQSIAEMAAGAQDYGLSYMLITDHSKSAFYANGLQESRVLAQHKEIESWNAKSNEFRIFKGIESDILRDGSLDYDDDILSTFDVVIASIHSVLNMNQKDATKRLIRAIENPYTRILGHMTGRLLLSRTGYPVDHQKIIDACAANGVSIEINANPHRLDIDWKWVPNAVEKGVLISINPDAHSVAGISDITYGVRVARKAGLYARDCLSAYTCEEFENWCRN